jgi:hypothetical protein
MPCFLSQQTGKPDLHEISAGARQQHRTAPTAAAPHFEEAEKELKTMLLQRDAQITALGLQLTQLRAEQKLMQLQNRDEERKLSGIVGAQDLPLRSTVAVVHEAAVEQPSAVVTAARTLPAAAPAVGPASHSTEQDEFQALACRLEAQASKVEAELQAELHISRDENSALREQIGKQRQQLAEREEANMSLQEQLRLLQDQHELLKEDFAEAQTQLAASTVQSQHVMLDQTQQTVRLTELSEALLAYQRDVTELQTEIGTHRHALVLLF